MKNQPIAPIDALNRLGGFHQYCLDEPVRLCYVSRSLCQMLGVSESALLSEASDGYLPFLHPEDREEYESILRQLAQAPQTKTIQYRLVCRDGRVLLVLDTMTSYELDGRRIADSVLTDVTGQQQERAGRKPGAICGHYPRSTTKFSNLTKENTPSSVSTGRIPPAFSGSRIFPWKWKAPRKTGSPAPPPRRTDSPCGNSSKPTGRTLPTVLPGFSTVPGLPRGR